MKISLNLAGSETLRDRYALVWAVPVTVAALICLIYLLSSLTRNIGKYHQIHSSVVEEQAQDKALRDQENVARQNLEKPEYRELVREAAFVNSLIAQKKLSVTELTAQVARLLPPQVRLNSLSLSQSAGGPIVHLGVEGNSQEPLETFLNNLEEDPDFTDVVITHEGFEPKSGAGAPVTITCTARYQRGRSRRGIR